MTNDSSIDRLEVLAYADGFLDSDPARKAELEERLQSSPDDMNRVRVYQAQNRALREYLEGRVNQPIPDRLFQVLEHRAQFSLKELTRTAALVLGMIASGATGWYIGQSNEPSQWTPHTSIEQAYRQSSEGASPLSPQSEIAPALGTDDLGWLSDNISLTFRMPDLTAHGFKIVNAQKLATSSGQVARLTYASESGEDFSLFLRVRWEERDSSMQLNEDGKISMAFWLDGPLASAVISKLPLEKTRAIAETVRSALRDQNVPTPLRNAESIPVPQGNAETVNQNQDQLAVPLKQPELKANGVSLPTSNTPAADRL